MLRFRLGLRRFAEQGFFPQLAQQLFQFAPLLFRCLGGLVETGIGRRSEAGRGQGRGQDAQGRQQQPEQEQGQQERQQPAKTTAAGTGTAAAAAGAAAAATGMAPPIRLRS